jgi:hypothetical protein
MTIIFTRFHKPNGRRSKVEIDRPTDIDKMARDLVRYGYDFEIEVLRGDEVHMTVSNEDGDMCSRICENGPQVPISVDSMIVEAHLMVLERRVSGYESH